MPRTRNAAKPVPVRRTNRVAHPTAASVSDGLLGDIRQLIEQARTAVAQTVNAGLVLLN